MSVDNILHCESNIIRFIKYASSKVRQFINVNDILKIQKIVLTLQAIILGMQVSATLISAVSYFVLPTVSTLYSIIRLIFIEAQCIKTRYYILFPCSWDIRPTENEHYYTLSIDIRFIY